MATRKLLWTLACASVLTVVAYQRVVKPSAIEAEDIKEKGNVAFKAGRYKLAIELYTRAIKLRSSESTYFSNRAASYMALKKFRLALEDCRRAYSLAESQPDSNAKTLLRLARCQLALGSITASLSTITLLLITVPSASFSASLLREEALSLQNRAHLLESHLNNFHIAKRKKNWALAESSLDKCLQGVDAEGVEIPIEWQVWKVELEIGRRRWQGADLVASDALRLHPKSASTLYTSGLLSFLTGKLTQSIKNLDSVLRSDSSHEAASKLWTRVKAVQKFKEAGNVAFREDTWGEAMKHYERALDLIGDANEEGGGGYIRGILLANRAAVLMKLDRYDEALNEVEISLNLYPTNFKALRTDARIHIRLGNYTQAIASYRSALEQAQHSFSLSSLSTEEKSSGGATQSDISRLRLELAEAEEALRSTNTKDYYKILGIPRGCRDQNQIKRAYRRESLLHHPDKGGDEENFKLVLEAYSVISDPHRRRLYDLGGN